MIGVVKRQAEGRENDREGLSIVKGEEDRQSQWAFGR